MLFRSANATLQWLMEVMPADATVTASLCKIGAKFLCKVDVLSSLGTFRGEALELNAQDAVDEAVGSVKTNARNWFHARLGLDGTSYLELMTH